jgi:transcriptional regulator with XRE-family HTH domain
MSRRHIIVDPAFAARLRELRTACGMSYRDFGVVSRSHVHDLETGRKQPSPEIAAALDRALGADGHLAQLVRIAPKDELPLPTFDDDEIEALELARRVAASDVGAETVTRLEWAVDDLATRYSVTPPAELLNRARRYLDYSARLLDPGIRKTLAEHRQIVVVSAWLSLIAATLHVDLDQGAAAAARLATAASLARHAGHSEIEAWVFETRAWQVLTDGDYPQAADLSRAAQRLAPKGSSVEIQAAAQEGRAWARMGQATETYAAINRVQQLVSPLPAPDRPEHHYQYDPSKAVSYSATTLAWLGDPAAEGYAREVIARLGGIGGWPRRVAAAQIDLALALLAAGRPEEAAGTALEAIESGRIVPSNHWRAREVVEAVEGQGLPEATDLRGAYEALHRGELTPLALPPGPSADE